MTWCTRFGGDTRTGSRTFVRQAACIASFCSRRDSRCRRTSDADLGESARLPPAPIVVGRSGNFREDMVMAIASRIVGPSRSRPGCDICGQTPTFAFSREHAGARLRAWSKGKHRHRANREQSGLGTSYVSFGINPLIVTRASPPKRHTTSRRAPDDDVRSRHIWSPPIQEKSVQPRTKSISDRQSLLSGDVFAGLRLRANSPNELH